ncbi:MAG: hypothetical protein HQL24_09040 [Candidatus Omnitrophica bacterium]|nr:hypothetical protein [Candidatus Omnitrophota bacterium]
MFRKIKSALQILIVVALTVQLAGCIFEDRDRRRHNDYPEHHNNDSGIDVRIHG